MKKNYKTGKIVGNPTYFLFLLDNLKKEFISGHVLFRWIEERKDTNLSTILKDKQIALFVYSSLWWSDRCRNNSPVCNNLNQFLSEKGELLGIIRKDYRLVNYIYRTRN